MFDPRKDEIVEHWLLRLNAPLKRLPVEEQTRVQEEVWQHLEALALANEVGGREPQEAWEAALEQFGDPELFGRQIAEEWRQSRAGFRADIAAIVFGLGLYALLWLIQHPLCELWFQSLRDAHGLSVNEFLSVLRLVIGYGGVISISVLIGFKYPLQAIKSAFYSHTLSGLGTLISSAVILITDKSMIVPANWSEMLGLAPKALVYICVYSLLWVNVAYLASVTKRGWYRPALADFKIALPRRRLKIAR